MPAWAATENVLFAVAIYRNDIFHAMVSGS
jgi:hypothetical protein